MHGLFSVAAGLNTFFLLGDEGGGNALARDLQLTLLFVPTSYGTVQPTGPDPASGKSVAEPLETAEQLPAEKALTPKATPDANTPKQQVQIEQQQKQLQRQSAKIDALVRLVCASNKDADICKEQ